MKRAPSRRNNRPTGPIFLAAVTDSQFRFGNEYISSPTRSTVIPDSREFGTKVIVAVSCFVPTWVSG